MRRLRAAVRELYLRLRYPVDATGCAGGWDCMCSGERPSMPIPERSE